MSEGIWGHSGVTGGEQYIIAVPDNGAQGMLAVQDWFRDNVPVKDGATGYKLVYGTYKGGERELGILFNAKHWSEVGIAADLDTDKTIGLWGFFRGQESVLILSQSDARDCRPAHLATVCSCCPHLYDLLYIGKLTEVSRETAEYAGSYTFDPSTGCFYTCILP